MNKIHPTAIVSNKAQLGNNITIGPFTVVHDNVTIEDNCSIASHVVIYDGARIEKNVQIFQGGSISNQPQDLKFKDEKSEFIIGENTIIREFATLHRGTIDKGFSKIGKNCLLMAYTHVAHDCIIGDNCIIANAVQIGGHVVIEDWVIIGGVTPVHQFVKIGQHTMVGGGFRDSLLSCLLSIPVYSITSAINVITHISSQKRDSLFSGLPGKAKQRVKYNVAISTTGV